MTSSAIYEAFSAWLAESASQFVVAVRVKKHTSRDVELSFSGINPAIVAWLTNHESYAELNVIAEWEGKNWDFLLSIDAEPLRALGGYICKWCPPENRQVFPDRTALWRDHLFEPLLEWVNEELACSDDICLYGSPSVGYTHAALLSKDDPRRSEPDICLPVRI